jgi:Rhodopirellula transposase DDE domain
MRIALITEKDWTDKGLPCEKTIGTILNRLGYCLRRVQKAKPLKKIPETDAIFDNLNKINKESDLREDSLRISIDTKAKVAYVIHRVVAHHVAKKPYKQATMTWVSRISWLLLVF